MADRKWYGFRSEASIAQGLGSSLYNLADGTVVEVTCVSEDPTGATYKWKDKVAVGEVVAYVSPGQKWEFPSMPPARDDEDVYESELDCSDDT